MEFVPGRRKSCLLRLRGNCPLRKLRRRTYDVSAAASSPIGPYCNDTSPPTTKQPISTVCSEPLPPPSRYQSICSLDQSEADVHMEEDPPAAQNRQNQEGSVEACMELDDVDPETGESPRMTPPPPVSH